MLPEKTCEWENCNQKFKRPEQLFQHVNQVHSRVSPYDMIISTFLGFYFGGQFSVD